MKSAPQTTALVTPESLLKHWQGHRSITRKAIEMFPEEYLFGFQPAPPMRSFGTLMIEVIGMIEPTLNGAEIGDFSWGEFGKMHTLFDVLASWREKAFVVVGDALPCGHFIPEEAPGELLAELEPFLAEA